MSEHVEYLKKMLGAMKKKGSRTVLMEREFLEKLCQEIDSLERVTAVDESPTDPSPSILHGGFFGETHK